jgi:hypothetical protein
VFTVTATDNVGNIAVPARVDFLISYGLVPLYDQTKAHKSGNTVPIKIRLVDANGVNVSSLAVVLHATSVIQIGTDVAAVLEDSGESNPDFDFRYDSVAGVYVFNLQTRGYGTGIYALKFTVGNDPNVHTVLFQVRE